MKYGRKRQTAPGFKYIVKLRQTERIMILGYAPLEVEGRRGDELEKLTLEGPKSGGAMARGMPV